MMEKELPHDWEWTTLGEVTDPLVEQQPPNPDADFVYVEISSVDNLRKTIVLPTLLKGDTAPTRARQKLKAGDVLVSMTRPNLNAVAPVPPSLDGAIASTGFHVLRPILVHTKWLFYAVQHPDFVTEMSNRVQGVVYPAIRPKDIESFSLPLPPKPEQERVVSELDKQFTRLDVAEKVLRQAQVKLSQYKAAVLKAACEGRLVPTEAELARVEGSSTEPKDWASATIGEVSTVVTKGSSPNWQGFRYEKHGIIFLRSQNVGWGYLNLGDVVFLPLSFNVKEKRSILQAGDVLLNIVGASIGRATVASEAVAGANINQAVALIRVDPEVMHPKFLLLCLLSPSMQVRINSEKVDVARANLSLGDIRALRVPLPPISEQVRIVAEFERRSAILQSVESAVCRDLIKANNLRGVILRHAFRGKLTVQETKDEPASVLLERIRKDREDEGENGRRERTRNTTPRRGRGIKPGVSTLGTGTPPTHPKPRRGAGNVQESACAPTGLPDSSDGPSLGLKPQALRPGPAGAKVDREMVPVPASSTDRQGEEKTAFLDLPREAQIDLVWEILLGRGALEKEAAIRIVAQILRDQGRAQFQRFRQGGPLYQAIAIALDRGIREGSFDRPRRGYVRALLTDPKDYSPDEWRLCLLSSLDHKSVDENDALRLAAEWGRETLGLEFARLREDGVILRGLREALEEAIRMGEVTRRRGTILKGGQG